MLKARISRTAVTGHWRWADSQWINGDSWIQPFSHPSLETATVAEGPSQSFVVRERLGSHVPRPREDCDSWPKDFIAVRLNSQLGSVRLTCGLFGTAPVFAREQDGVLHASWDLADLPLTGAALNEIEIARLLTLQLRYTSDTIFNGVYRVTERSSLETSFTGRPVISYPSAALHSGPRTLRPGADIIAAYEQLLDEVLSGNTYDETAALVEISGSLDSANVALSAAARPGGHLLRPGAIILDGQRGTQQLRRRDELIRACGFVRPGIIVPALASPPLHPNGARARGLPVSPYGQPYHETMTGLHQRASDAGILHVLTGIGGEEMVALRASQAGPQPARSDMGFTPWITSRTRNAAKHTEDRIAPAGPVNETTLIAIGSAAPVILGSGSWPIHPFADPRLITFGEWLPQQWRRGKKLHRERLIRRGISPDVAYPQIPEVFTAIIDHSLQHYGTDLGQRLGREGGHLTDSGLIDPSAIRAACDRLSSRQASPRDREIFDVLALELAIRSLTRDGSINDRASCP